VTSSPTAVLHSHQTSVVDVVIHEALGKIFSYSKDAVSFPPTKCLNGNKISRGWIHDNLLKKVKFQEVCNFFRSSLIFS